MTYPDELREITRLTDSLYPVNLFCNVCPSGAVGRSALYLHWHDHFELIFLASGRAVFHIDSQPYEVCPGDLLMVPSGSLHVGYAMTEDRVEYWSLVFNRLLLTGSAGDPVHERYLSPYLEGRLRLPVRLDGNDRDLAEVRAIVKRIKDEFERKAPAFEIVVRSELTSLFARLARMYLPAGERETAPVDNKRTERFKSLIVHIQSHYRDKLTVTDAARMVHLTPHHFCKVFKAATGMTFIEFVNRCRMDEAERLLRRGGLTVTETAERVGCANLNYFTRLFKQVKGMTPSEAAKRGQMK